MYFVYLSKMKQHGIFDSNHRNLSRFFGALFITVCLSIAQALNCSNHKVFSKITINVKPGHPFNVTCSSDDNAPLLNIIDYEKYYTDPKQMIKNIINESAIQLTEPKAKSGKYSFICVCGGNGFQETFVNVGSSPKDVDDFDCVVSEFREMNCTIYTSIENIFTTYYLLIGESKVKNITYKQFNILEKLVFTESGSLYSTGQQYYNVTFIASNEFGNNNVSKIFDQYSIVKPELHDVELSKIKSDGVTITWNVPNFTAYKNYTHGLIYNMSIESEKFNFFKNDFDIENDNDQFWVEVSNLYSFVEFRVHLRVKANSTANIDKLWSEKFEANFTTLSSRPKKSPEIDVGSFYLHPKTLPEFHPERKNITLFWRQVPECEQYGPNFTYQITNIKENEKEIGVLLPPTKKNFATIQIDWKNTSQYEFTLKSINQNGPSLNTSILKIGPRFSNIRTHEEQFGPITKLFYNQSYEVLWLKPINFTALSSFTLFWCSATELNNQCTGPINFKTLDRNTFSYTTKKLNTTLNFALSENYYNNSYSSGMMWAKCSLKPESNSFQFKLNNVTIPTEDSITVQWVEECWHMTVIDGYNVTYCEDNTNDCITEHISDKTAKDYKINKLKPSTSYKITITLKMKLGSIQISDSIVRTTKNGRSTTKDVIIAFSFIGVVALIVLAYYSMKKIYKIMEIVTILPFDYDEEVKFIERNVNDQRASEQLINTEDYEENIFSANLSPLQESREIFQPCQLNTAPNHNSAAAVATPTDRYDDQAREQPFSQNFPGYHINSE